MPNYGTIHVPLRQRDKAIRRAKRLGWRVWSFRYFTRTVIIWFRKER
jgi:hypothetical protein